MVNPGNGPFVSCKWCCRWSSTLSSVLRSAGTSSTILKLFEKLSRKLSGLPVVPHGEWSSPVLKSAAPCGSDGNYVKTGNMFSLISSFGCSWNSHWFHLDDFSIPVVTTEYTLRMGPDGNLSMSMPVQVDLHCGETTEWNLSIDLLQTSQLPVI